MKSTPFFDKNCLMRQNRRMQVGLRRGLRKECVARLEENPARSPKSSAGRPPGRRKWSCVCCAASRSMLCPGKSPCQSTSLNSGGIGPWPGSMPVSRSARTTRSPTNSMTPTGALANWSWKSRSCKRKGGQSAVWSAGGRRSEGAGKHYGLERVCRILDFPRSTIYEQQARESTKVAPLHPMRRGPKPTVSDAELLVAIRADLEASPFSGEGHRKLWARLRLLRDIRVSRARVLRLMRENALLSPHRRPQGNPVLHDGSLQTNRPNAMWGTDGIRIETVDEGWVWVFAAVDHFDACCVGIHAVKTGNRFAAGYSGPS